MFVYMMSQRLHWLLWLCLKIANFWATWCVLLPGPVMNVLYFCLSRSLNLNLCHLATQLKLFIVSNFCRFFWLVYEDIFTLCDIYTVHFCLVLNVSALCYNRRVEQSNKNSGNTNCAILCSIEVTYTLNGTVFILLFI